MKYLLPILLLCGFLGCTVRAQNTATETSSPTYIILKVDDLKGLSPRWQKLIDFITERQIKIAIGIICNSLDKDNPDYFDWIKKIQQTGLVEFWFHGYDHQMWKENGKDVREFQGSSYELQKDHFVRSKKLAQEKLGITFHTFGSPFNATDANTNRVLAEDPDFNVFLYASKQLARDLPDMLLIERTALNIEGPIKPNSQKVREDWAKLAGTQDCFVLQGHPGSWDDESFAEFVKLVDFLAEQKVIFTTPIDYYRIKKGTP
jgi:peptidoglycan/xylan/chitin deacetylase (PgdA/CDA1 family)